MTTVEIKVDEIDNNKICDKDTDTHKYDNDIDKPHTGNCNYDDRSITNLVTYSGRDHGWNVEDKGSFKFDMTIKLSDKIKLNDISNKIDQLCVFDDNKLAYIDHYKHLGKL
jgi:hypothetical protein